jgi:hypothetical protein
MGYVLGAIVEQNIHVEIKIHEFVQVQDMAKLIIYMHAKSHPAEGSDEGMAEVVGLILGAAEGANEGWELGCREGEALGDFEGLFSEGKGKKKNR